MKEGGTRGCFLLAGTPVLAGGLESASVLAPIVDVDVEESTEFTI